MVELMRIFLPWTVFIFASTAFANGSTGVGTVSVPIIAEIEASNLQGAIARTGDTIVDNQTGKPILQLSSVSAPEFSGDAWVPARLGSVEGYEFTPDMRDRVAKNAWVVCAKSNACAKLEALSSTDLVSDLLGTLHSK